MYGKFRVALAPNDDVRADLAKRVIQSKQIDVVQMEPRSREELRSRFTPQADVFVIPSHGEGFIHA